MANNSREINYAESLTRAYDRRSRHGSGYTDSAKGRDARAEHDLTCGKSETWHTRYQVSSISASVVEKKKKSVHTDESTNGVNVVATLGWASWGGRWAWINSPTVPASFPKWANLTCRARCCVRACTSFESSPPLTRRDAPPPPPKSNGTARAALHHGSCLMTALTVSQPLTSRGIRSRASRKCETLSLFLPREGKRGRGRDSRAHKLRICGNKKESYLPDDPADRTSVVRYIKLNSDCTDLSET